MLAGDEDSTAGCKQMAGYLRLICLAAYISAALGMTTSTAASGGGTETARKLSEEVARAAISRAEQAVRRAQAQRMVWTTSEEALGEARRALAKGELAAAVARARVAEEQAELAIAQKRYPPFRIR